MYIIYTIFTASVLIERRPYGNIFLHEGRT